MLSQAPRTLAPELVRLFDALGEPVSVFALDGTYLYINDAGARLIVKQPAEVLGRVYLDVFSDLADHPFHAAFQRIASGASTTEHLEFYYAPLELWSSQHLYGVDGRITVFWRDITASKRTELALAHTVQRVAESESRFRTMIEGMPQLAWRAQPDGFIDYYNPRWYEYTGKTVADMEGWGWQAVHDPALLPSVMERWQQSIATGKPFEMEFPLRRHDGTFRWFITRVTPQRDEAGQIMCWIGINTDIDEQKRSLAVLDDTLESMGDAFFMLDRAWRIVQVNRNQERLSQVPRAQSLGRPFWEVFPPTADPGSRYWTEYHRVMDERVASHFEEYYAPLDLWTEVDALPSQDHGIAVFFRDITERKRIDQLKAHLLESEQAARAAAEAANRTKDDFLALLGHELRNPLAPISAALQTMRSRGVIGAEREQAIIERQVTHLVRLVDDLLDVSRITTGKIELATAAVDLASVIANSIERVTPLIEARHHTVISEVPAGLRVLGDAHRLEQVFGNLLTNAAKYTPPHGRVTVTVNAEEACVAVRIADTGVGIAPALLSRIFEPFVQERQALDRAAGGLGLGLAIVRRLIELHHGAVEATSAGVGHGATFVVRLPLLVHDSFAPSAPPATPVLLSAPAPRRVLIVDDNIDGADLFADMLGTLGHTTCVAYDGPSALALIDSFAPDVAILDIGLPVLDGYELARRIRASEQHKGIRLFALTGYGQADDRDRALAAGFDAHLVKPVDFARLRALMAGTPEA